MDGKSTFGQLGNLTTCMAQFGYLAWRNRLRDWQVVTSLSRQLEMLSSAQLTTSRCKEALPNQLQLRFLSLLPTARRHNRRWKFQIQRDCIYAEYEGWSWGARLGYLLAGPGTREGESFCWVWLNDGNGFDDFRLLRWQLVHMQQAFVVAVFAQM